MKLLQPFMVYTVGSRTVVKADDFHFNCNYSPCLLIALLPLFPFFIQKHTLVDILRELDIGLYMPACMLSPPFPLSGQPTLERHDVLPVSMNTFPAKMIGHDEEKKNNRKKNSETTAKLKVS